MSQCHRRFGEETWSLDIEHNPAVAVAVAVAISPNVLLVQT